MAEGGRHAEPVLPASAEGPVAEAQVADVVQDEETQHDHERGPTDTEEQQGDERTGRQPGRPDQAVADAAERAAERRAESFNALRGHHLDLGPGERTDGEPREIRMGIEIRRLTREGLTIRLPIDATRKLAQRGFDAEPDPVADEDLVVPGALNGETPQVHRES